MRCMITANRRARATIAFFSPRCRAIFIAQALSQDRRRNEIIEEICAAEERHKVEECEAWHSYEKAVIALLTTRPTTMAGIIAAMSYVALPECSGPGVCETILDGARLSSNAEAAAAAEHFPALSAEDSEKSRGGASKRRQFRSRSLTSARNLLTKCGAITSMSATP